MSSSVGISTTRKISTRRVPGLVGRGEDVHPQDAGGDGADQAQGRHHGEAHHRVRLPPQAVAVEVLVHVLNLLPHLGEEPLGIEVLPPEEEEIPRLVLGGDLVEPVAVGKAEKGCHRAADGALEPLDRLDVPEVEPAQRHHQAIGQHQQRRLVEVGQQAEDEVLPLELALHAGLRISEEPAAMLANHEEGVPGADEAGVGPIVRFRRGPVPVVTELLLEARERRTGKGQRIVGRRPSADREPDEVGAVERARVVE